VKPGAAPAAACAPAAPAHAALRPWVEGVWSCARPDRAVAAAREHSLPNGAMHLVVRLDGPPLRLYADPADRRGRGFGPATLAGVRSGYCIKDLSQPAASVGAVLRPGAAMALFGVSAAELAGQHVDLHDLCGAPAQALYQRLAACADPERRRAVFERFLLERLRPLRRLDPQIVLAAQRLQREPAAVAAMAAGAGRSHRHFIAGFRDATGLSPKRYARVQRFRRLLERLRGETAPDWADLALAAGYADQSHLIREFGEFAGVSPGRYLAAGVRSPQHLPLA